MLWEVTNAILGTWIHGCNLHLFLIIKLASTTKNFFFPGRATWLHFDPELKFFSPILLCINLFLAVLGLCCWAHFSLVVASRGYANCGAWASPRRAWVLGCMGSVAGAPHRAWVLGCMGSVAGAPRRAWVLGCVGSVAGAPRRAWVLGCMGSIAGAPRLQSTDSKAVAHGLSCSAACGVFPDQGKTRVSCPGRQILYP